MMSSFFLWLKSKVFFKQKNFFCKENEVGEKMCTFAGDRRRLNRARMNTEDYIRRAEEVMMATEQTGWAAGTFLMPTRETTIQPDAGRDAAAEEAAVEWHPLIPFLPRETRVLFLGSFPPQRKRWCMDFFYPNFTNDHWRIEGLAFYGDAKFFVDEGRKTFRLRSIVEHLKTKGIGFFDTALAVRRLADNASDKFLEVVEPTDIRALVGHHPELKAIVTTGEKATETIALSLGMTNAKGRAVLPDVGTALPSPIEGVELYRLPSSSRAYPMPLTKKAEAYARMFSRYLLKL